MKKLLKIVLIAAVAALNAMAVLHSSQKERMQEKPIAAKPLRNQLKEVSFVLLPNLVKA